LRALLIDDERLARDGLRRLLKPHEDVEIIGEAQNAQEASQKIQRLEPDLVFLDIEMPRLNGLQLLENLEDVPLVVFTTAYHEYAARAFDVCAVDFLVKPIVPDRLTAAMNKVRKAFAATGGGPNRRRQVFLRDGKRCWIVMVEEIRLLESVGNYTRVHFAENSPLICKSLNALEHQLDPALFFRASRSHIINLHEVKSLDEESRGGLVATLSGGYQVTMTRRQSRRLRGLLSL
jgi:two-component system, LytTR family, response regulator